MKKGVRSRGALVLILAGIGAVLVASTGASGLGKPGEAEPGLCG
jgi:hypothetical protein